MILFQTLLCQYSNTSISTVSEPISYCSLKPGSICEKDPPVKTGPWYIANSSESSLVQISKINRKIETVFAYPHFPESVSIAVLIFTLDVVIVTAIDPEREFIA